MPKYNKKDFQESNINYLNKDFTQFKSSLINYAQSYFPDTYQDFNETSPGMMFIEMMSYVGDVTSFYIDQQYREMLLPLAEERRNLIIMSRMFGYKVKPIVPSHVILKFTSDVDAIEEDRAKIDYRNAGTFGSGIQVVSNTNTNLIFETLEEVDFSISASNDTEVVSSIAETTGLVETYTLSRNVKAISGETISREYTIGVPEKFRKITLPESNIIDIISCIDSNGNDWYQVDFLAQDKIPIPKHYTADGRDNAYYNLDGTPYLNDIAVPYSLEYIKTSKRFTKETNTDNTTSLVFGNGILRNGTTIDEGFLDLEQLGIIIPGQSQDLNESINPLLGDDYSTLGETPSSTVLTITYRIGGGINANSSAGDITSLSSDTVTRLGGSSTLSAVTNDSPAVGGRDKETLSEIREKTRAFFSTQNRAVTKEDYEARILNLQSKFGAVAKVYVSRINALTNRDNVVENVSDYISGVSSLLLNIESSISSPPPDAQDDEILNAVLNQLNMFNDTHTTPNVDNLENILAPNTVLVYILANNQFGNLIGNPNGITMGTNDYIPLLLKQNIKSYLENFRLLTDDIHISDGYIINFGVFFDVVSHQYANKQNVKIKCIDLIKNYFQINKMQFSQPISISQIEYELMGVDGVRAVNYVTITQDYDYNLNEGGETFDPPLYRYHISQDGEIFDNSNTGYGYKYDFKSAVSTETAKLILPANPQNPSVFELKSPNDNIKGVVR